MKGQNQKNTKSENATKSHIFEIHTMQSDNEAKKNPNKQIIDKKELVNNTTTQGKSQKVIAKTAAPFMAKKMQESTKDTPMPIPKSVSVPKNTQTKNINENNPFLTEEKFEKSEVKKQSFAPGKKEDIVEKINYSPSDIAPKKDKEVTSEKSQKKLMHVIMVVFVIIFLVGAVGFGIFLFNSNDDKSVVEEASFQTNTALNELEDELVQSEDLLDDNKIIDSEDSQNTENTEQLYSTDFPNYFTVDTNSATSEEDIIRELDLIEITIQKNNLTGPISFIVTDKNDNPVSFNVFAMSAGMDIPNDILSSLEESFEIYAYDDVNGIRFGFVVDAKNIDSLKTALIANEQALPVAFDLILNGLGKSATEVMFADGIYQTHPIRYYNLNKEETYSVDYLIKDRRFIMGASKNTVRAMIDNLKETQL